jgi:hypothetical protein
VKKGQNPNILITELEDYQMRLEDLGSRVSDNQFIIHILNNMTDDCNIQPAIISNTLTVKEI